MGVVPRMAYTGKVCLKGVPFQAPGIYQGHCMISQVEVYESIAKSAILV